MVGIVADAGSHGDRITIIRVVTDIASKFDFNKDDVIDERDLDLIYAYYI